MQEIKLRTKWTDEMFDLKNKRNKKVIGGDSSTQILEKNIENIKSKLE